MATVIDELEIKVNSSGVDALMKTLERMQGAMAGATQASKQLGAATAGAGKAAASASKGAGQFLSSIVRIAKYRLIRTAIREITQAIKEGTESFYNFSKATGAPFAAAMDSVRGSASTMRAQVGAEFGALFTAVAPIISSLINLLTKLASVMSMVFSALGGGKTWYKAADGASALGDAVGGAGGAAETGILPPHCWHVMSS